MATSVMTPARPATPPTNTLSAPSTPVTHTSRPLRMVHHLSNGSTSMERCRSAEASVTYSAAIPVRPTVRVARDQSPSPLLFTSPPENTGEQLTEARSRTGSCTPAEQAVTPQVAAAIQEENEKVEEQKVWGMDRWGWEPERKEVRRGVRLVGAEELPDLLEKHSMVDTPSQVLFPWLHGISDDGDKGREMASFFGKAPPFEPPPYRGLCVLLAPVKATSTDRAGAHRRGADKLPSALPPPNTPAGEENTLPVYDSPTPTRNSPVSEPVHLPRIPSRERSLAFSASTASAESYESSATATTAATSVSSSDGREDDKLAMSVHTEGEEESTQVIMHPCEAMRQADPEDIEMDSDSDDMEMDEDERPSCILLNALHVQDIFDLPIDFGGHQRRDLHAKPAFRRAKLPQQINLRNLHIQQIKYATISDVIMYCKGGVGDGILDMAAMISQAQEELYTERWEIYYKQAMASGTGEGIDRPMRYGVWVVVEPFAKIEKLFPHLVNLDHRGCPTYNSRKIDLFEREAFESRMMTKASEVVPGFWVGNDCDVPDGGEPGSAVFRPFDLCVRASEMCEMPAPAVLTRTLRRVMDLELRRAVASGKTPPPPPSPSTWGFSPATVALRNLLAPLESAAPAQNPAAEASPAASQLQGRSRSSIDFEYVKLDCAGSGRTISGHTRNLCSMAEKIVTLVLFLRKIIEGRDSDRTAEKNYHRRVLVHCQDGYTESSIMVLSYIMSSLSLTLPEAYLYLQNNARRSFFLYPCDKPLLRRVDACLTQERKAKAAKLLAMSGTAAPSDNPHAAPTPSRWKHWGMGFHRGASSSPVPEDDVQAQTVNAAKSILFEEGKEGRAEALQAKVWFDAAAFDGFPSRILPFLYLGNLQHAANAPMLEALHVTHVVSVGESLLSTASAVGYPAGVDMQGPNSLSAAAEAGKIKVLDLTDVRDDGNDPLRPLVARAVEWVEDARKTDGAVLVHCRVGVSRSASIVIAYLMKYRRMPLMDAYLLTRARRLNVLIQPNLRFFHELFGWEVELAREEQAQSEKRRDAALARGVRDPNALELIGPGHRDIVYTWPSFCRDVHCLNRRFLCQ